MDVQNVRYADSNNGAINATIDGTNYSIPVSPSNRHYRMIQEWVAEGNTIAPYIAPAPSTVPLPSSTLTPLPFDNIEEL